MKVGAGSMIELMKFDMGGCAAVLGCAKAIAQLRPKVTYIISLSVCMINEGNTNSYIKFFMQHECRVSRLVCRVHEELCFYS